MEQSYKRIRNIDEKIHAAKLPYMAWKVLFLIEDEDTAPKLAEIMDADHAEVDLAVQSLISAGLIETIEPETDKKDQEAEAEKAQPEPEEAAEAEVIPEDTESDEKKAPKPDEIPETEKEAQPAVEEIVAEAEPEKEAEKEAAPAEEEPVPEKPEEPEEAPSEEKAAAEAETIEDEELDIKITEEETAEEVETGLDVDFAEDTPEEEEAEQDEAVELKTTDVEEADGNTILVIDDSIVIRKMVEIALEDEDFRIETAVSGKEGLSMIDKINPSLVILDLMLPDISGIDILKTIKASRGIPVIMLSGKDSPQMVETAKNEGANAFLPKPFKDEELVEQIKKLVNKS